MDTAAVTACEAPTVGSRSPEAHAPIAYVVVVHKGPTWTVEDIEPYCRLLSRRFTGEVWAWGSYDADLLVDRMRLRAVALEPFHGIANFTRITRRALGWIEELRKARLQRLVIVALNPFMSGLLGLYAARRTGGALICEVNGAYANRHNMANSRSASVGSVRAALRRLAGWVVLRRSAAVRLLYRGQLDGFASLPERVVTRQFFETTNLEAFHPGAEEMIILAVGHPFRVKGFDTLCRAFSRISDRYPSWKLVLIGHRAPEEVREAGFEHPRVEVHPGLMQPEVAEWMARCAIFALPSRTEAMGRVLLEAGAAGKCRVATRVDGIPTVIEDGVDGLLVESENVEELAAALERAMSDEAVRRRLGDAARRRVEREFSAESYLDHYSELVTAALDRGRA